MRQFLFFLLSFGILLGISCQSPERQMVGKWQVESYRVPSLESSLRQQEQSIDTLSHIDSTILASYHTDNIDSLKVILKRRAEKQIENYKKAQEADAILTSYHFLMNGQLVMETGIRLDTDRWERISKDELLITSFSNPQKQTGLKKDTLKIEKIAKDRIKLKSLQHNHALYINLRPFTREDSLKAMKLLHEREEYTQRQMEQRAESEKESDDKK